MFRLRPGPVALYRARHRRRGGGRLSLFRPRLHGHHRLQYLEHDRRHRGGCGGALALPRDCQPLLGPRADKRLRANVLRVQARKPLDARSVRRRPLERAGAASSGLTPRFVSRVVFGTAPCFLARPFDGVSARMPSSSSAQGQGRARSQPAFVRGRDQPFLRVAAGRSRGRAHRSGPQGPEERLRQVGRRASSASCRRRSPTGRRQGGRLSPRPIMEAGQADRQGRRCRFMAGSPPTSRACGGCWRWPSGAAAWSTMR